MVCLQNGMGMKGPADLKSAEGKSNGRLWGQNDHRPAYGAKLWSGVARRWARFNLLRGLNTIGDYTSINAKQ